MKEQQQKYHGAIEAPVCIYTHYPSFVELVCASSAGEANSPSMTYLRMTKESVTWSSVTNDYRD